MDERDPISVFLFQFRQQWFGRAAGFAFEVQEFNQLRLLRDRARDPMAVLPDELGVRGRDRCGRSRLVGAEHGVPDQPGTNGCSQKDPDSDADPSA